MSRLLKSVGSLDSLIGKVAVVLAAGAAITSLMGTVLDPRVRPALCFVTGLLFCFAARQSQPSRVVGFDTSLPATHEQRRFVWWLLAILFLSLCVFELGARYSGLVPLAKIEGPFFQVIGPSGDYDQWPFGRMPFSSDLQKEWGPEVLKYRNRKDIDGFTMAGAITQKTASSLYTSPLTEHFMFDVWKTEHTNRVRIEDIWVTVHDYEGVPDYAMGPSENVYNNYIAVVNLDRREDELPWEFKADLLLTDPANLLVLPWNRSSVVLADSRPQRFLVKIAARQGGIYTYSARLTIKDAMNVLSDVELISADHPRKCMFEGGVQPQASSE